jgi:hypothetical protein
MEIKPATSFTLNKFKGKVKTYTVNRNIKDMALKPEKTECYTLFITGME